MTIPLLTEAGSMYLRMILHYLLPLSNARAYQDYDSLLAVATVIMNRVESPRFPNSISGCNLCQRTI